MVTPGSVPLPRRSVPIFDLALLAAIHNAARTDQITQLEARDMCAHDGYPADDFMARHVISIGSRGSSPA